MAFNPGIYEMESKPYAYETVISEFPSPERRIARATPLAPYNPEHRTRTTCLIGLCLTYVLSLAAIFLPAVLLYGKATRTMQSTTTKEIVTLLLNICVTVCTECLGFIHSISLRWALYNEGRLRYNSNLRLFTSAKHCAANKWYTNCLWALALAFSYSSVSQAILPTGSDHTGSAAYIVSPQALSILGAALLLQALLATWCIIPRKGRQILSWNSSPLNTALANLHRDADQQLVVSRHPSAPKFRQQAAQKIIPALRKITVALWAIVPLVTIWGAVTWYLALKDTGSADTSFSPEDDTDGVYPESATAGGEANSWLWRPDIDTIINIFIITSMQLLYTLALHAAEQVVNLSRDETQWRNAGTLTKGAQISLSSSKAALTSWQTLTLLALKPVSHWLFGLSAVTFSYGYLAFHPLPIFCLAAMSLFLATLVTVLGFRRPKGPQPATYGDLVKLAGYIDNWGTSASGKLFWGDKGVEQYDGNRVVRVAGTSPNMQYVSEIRMNGELYWNLGEEEDK
jgi:hypothetical protein